MTRLRKHWWVLAALGVPACVLPGTRANAQEGDLIEAASSCDLARVKALIEAKADVNAVSETGDTALCNAAANRHPDMVRLLKAAGAVDRPPATP